MLQISFRILSQQKKLFEFSSWMGEHLRNVSAFLCLRRASTEEGESSLSSKATQQTNKVSLLSKQLAKLFHFVSVVWLLSLFSAIYGCLPIYFRLRFGFAISSTSPTMDSVESMITFTQKSLKWKKFTEIALAALINYESSGIIKVKINLIVMKESRKRYSHVKN